MDTNKEFLDLIINKFQNGEISEEELLKQLEVIQSSLEGIESILKDIKENK